MAGGYYGKVPMRGDFISHGLPFAMVERLHEWLAEGLAGAQAVLGARWDDLYLTAPIWHFAWPADLCGDVLAGVMLPSVDAVGRRFPLLALGFATAEAAHLALAGGDWYAAAETVLLSALADGATMADFQRDMAALPSLPATPTMPLHALAARTPLPAGQSLWWTAGAPHLPPALLAIGGWPSAADFALLMGDGAAAPDRLRPWPPAP